MGICWHLSPFVRLHMKLMYFAWMREHIGSAEETLICRRVLPLLPSW